MWKRNVNKQQGNDESEDLPNAAQVEAKTTLSVKHLLLLFFMAIVAVVSSCP
jgi:hypothetical protein